MLVGCAPASEVDFRVVVVGDDPFLGADALSLEVRDQAGGLVSSASFAPTERILTLPELPFGRAVRIEVTTLLGGLPLAAGRSFSFAVPGPGVPPLNQPDVTLGLLGRHALAVELPPGTAIRAVAPTLTGALLASDVGVHPFLAHGPDGRPTVLDAIPWPSGRMGAALVPLAGGLLAVGGDDAGATWLDGRGRVGSTLEGAPFDALSNIALAALDGESAIAVGGRDRRGAPIAGALTITWVAGEIQARALPPLDVPRAEARALAIEASSGAGAAPRVLIVDGVTPSGAATDYLVIDPEGIAPPMLFTPPSPRAGAAIARVAAGQVMLAGGEDGVAPIGDVDVLFVSTERPLDLLSPAPMPLFVPRAGAIAVPYTPGVSLVLGGRDADGRAIATSELVDLRVLPGSIRATGNFSWPSTDASAAVLGDGTILVASGPVVTLYFPFRP